MWRISCLFNFSFYTCPISLAGQVECTVYGYNHISLIMLCYGPKGFSWILRMCSQLSNCYTLLFETLRLLICALFIKLYGCYCLRFGSSLYYPTKFYYQTDFGLSVGFQLCIQRLLQKHFWTLKRERWILKMVCRKCGFRKCCWSNYFVVSVSFGLCSDTTRDWCNGVSG